MKGTEFFRSVVLFVAVVELVWFHPVRGEDYYEVLGVSKDATNKEIRKAFKNLALVHHPDKNTNDPDAHEKFMKITNIYEVLKDEELRKKYDRYGEEGLKEDFKGGRYESYNFYKDEFGIYDDDPEVTTLDQSDFDSAVKSGEIWFINFYSPRCSHCHDLAPTWRAFAQEMEGVINIGAMNCRDNRWTCQNNGVHSYPTLMLFTIGRRPIRYQGDRNKRDLIKFVMQYVTVQVVELWDGNFDSEVQKHTKLPWVLSFCGGSSVEDGEEFDSGSNCPTLKTKRKLAGMLRDLATVAVVDCANSADLCKKLEHSEELLYYPKGAFPDKPEKAVPLNSLDAKEIYDQILRDLVPGLPVLSASSLKSRVRTQAMLVLFQFGGTPVDQADTSLKRLPLVLRKHNIGVGVVNCENEKEFCGDTMHIKEATTTVFKGKGLEMFEVFHGRQSTSELSAFAQESSRSRVTTLNSQIFEDGDINSSEKPWFVDFFAPWCPPCRALLPELREASLILPTIQFGTIDCTKFSEICDNYGVDSYPTTMLFNGSIVTEYNGQHNSYGIRQFVQDLIDPPYIHLTPKTFLSMVQRRPVGETWVVDFYANWCGPCQRLLPEWRRMAKTLGGIVKVAAVDCAKPGHSEFCRMHAIDSYPEIRLFPPRKRESHNPLYEIYRGWDRRGFKLAEWAMKYVKTEVVELTAKDFKNGHLKDEEPWLIDFFAPWCGHCHAFAPKFAMASLKLKGRVKCGKVDCQAFPSVCRVAGVNAYPSVRFYPPTKPGEKKTTKHNIDSQDPQEIVEEVNRFLLPYAKKDGESVTKKKDEL